jgi:hypothetical protein
MFFVHGSGTEAALPEMAAAVEPDVESACVVALDTLKGMMQAIEIVWRSNHMDMIGHQTVGLDADAVVARMLFEQFQVQGSVGVAEEDLLSEIAAMADMMG